MLYVKYKHNITMNIDLIAGARPNFMKISAIIDAIHGAQSTGNQIYYRLIHTGQHYDKNMSDTFFDELKIPKPDINLEAGGGSQAEQTAAIMIGYEKLLLKMKPDLCLVVGDVTSTLACSICAQKMQVKVAHVEGGIRSFDWSMPEEINRMVTDSITNYFFTTSEFANKNLHKMGISDDRIFFVGNTMIDTLLKHRPNFKKPELWDKIGLSRLNYLILTLHRPSNVDQESRLRQLVQEILDNSKDLPIIFPIHPRTAKIFDKLQFEHPRLHLTAPLGYLEFNYLIERCKAVITDSGGITEESTVLGIPCMTLRSNTERPETVSVGTNELLGTQIESIEPAMKKLFSGNWKKGTVPIFWDGKTSERIISHIIELI
jgi:UDP-N-acetylglucosamine 2-epimerase (non-hydrolysing)